MSLTDEAVGVSNLALTLVSQGNVAAGLALCRRAIAMAPDDWRMKAYAAHVCVNHGLVDEAAAYAAECPQDEPWVKIAQGFVHLERADPAGAAVLFGQACRQQPGHPDWMVARAQSILASGNWGPGFRLHEVRPKRQQMAGAFPRWDGSRVDRLLAWSDEGFGDAVMFARYIPLLAERVGRVVLGVPPSVYALLRGYEKYAEIVPAWDGLKADAEVALMSLPMHFDTTPDTIPPDPGLLNLPPINGILTEAGKRNIGIAWTGNQDFKRRFLRDMPFEIMLGLAEDSDNRLYSVVVWPRSKDIGEAGAQGMVTDLSGLVQPDFSATAAVINAMDAVVTTCNGIAHLAGALGKPTFLCLATLPDWRWLYGRSDTPWYPSVTLVRQKKPMEWAPVIAEVRERLAEMSIKIPTQERAWGERAKKTPWA